MAKLQKSKQPNAGQVCLELACLKLEPERDIERLLITRVSRRAWMRRMSGDIRVMIAEKRRADISKAASVL